MNERVKNVAAGFKDKWGKWTPVQKGIAAGIIIVVIVAVFFLFRTSSRSSDVRLFGNVINDQNAIDKITLSLDEENVWYEVRDGFIYVKDDRTARQWRPRLVAKGVVPDGLSYSSVFDETNWTRTDFDDAQKYREAMENRLRNNLIQLNGIENAIVNIEFPEDALFASQQKPVSASVTIFASSGIALERKSIEGIHKICLKSIAGLTADNLVILEGGTLRVLNDFEGMAESDALTQREREQKLRQLWEAKYSSDVVQQLNNIFTDRVHIALMSVEINFSTESSESTEYSGITVKPRTPGLAYDDSITVESTVISEETVNKSYTGTQFTPEGIPGVAGQNAPSYADNLNTIGQVKEEGAKKNYGHNVTHKVTDRKPEPGRRTISVNIDSKWERELDESGDYVVDETNHIKRVCTDLTEQELAVAQKIVEDAIGYKALRGDSVTVANLRSDHSKEFEEEDREYLKKKQRNKMIILSLIGVSVVLVFFILFRIISREIERRRRLREEEALRRQREEREKALWDAKESGMEVTMSVEERKRAELQESAIAMAKEHPEDVAMLIRTWLMEE